MAFWDFLKPSIVNKNETRVARNLGRRNYAAANQGRLFEDFKASNRSADTELRPALTTLRNRARDLSRNDPYARRFLNLKLHQVQRKKYHKINTPHRKIK